MKFKDYKDFDTLEVGKTYLNRKGEEVRIIRDNGKYINRSVFLGSNEEEYFIDGGHFTIHEEINLIKEVVEKEYEVKDFDTLKLGKTYLTSDGEEVKITYRFPLSFIQPFMGSNESIYFYNGINCNSDMKKDLIKEIVEEKDDKCGYWGATPKGFVIDLIKELVEGNDTETPLSNEKMEDANPSPYDFVNPGHYKKYNKEVWEMMIDIWGEEKFIAFCEMNSFKYRLRLGDKPSNEDKDLQKAQWYEKKIKELKS